MDIYKNLISKTLLWGIPSSASFQSRTMAVDRKVTEASQAILAQLEDPSLSPVPNKKMDDVPPKETQNKMKKQICDLPPKMLAKINSYLGSEDLQNVATTNKVMQHAVMTEVNDCELSLIKNFIQLLIQGLAAETYSQQRKTLEKILQDIIPKKFENQEDLENQLVNIKEQESLLISVMTTLDSETFNTLSQLHPPKSMKYFFAASACERFFQIHESIQPQEIEMQEFHQTIKNLISIDKNVGVALNLNHHSEMLASMANRSLEETGNIDRAIDFVNMLPEISLKAYTVLQMSRDLIHEKKFDRAFDVAKMISPELSKNVHVGYSHPSYRDIRYMNLIGIRNMALLEVSCALVLENMNKALEIVEMIPEDIREDVAFEALFTVLVKNIKFNQAIEIIEMQSENKRGLHLVQLCNILMAHEKTSLIKPDEMLRIADKISADNTRNHAYQLIAIAINKDNPRQAWKVSEMISHPEKKAKTQYILIQM